MNNIFKNAYFGKAYKTRDGRKAIYLGENRFDSGEVFVVHEGSTSSHRFMKDGHFWATPNVETDEDIVSEWQEPINEEELEELANDEAQLYSVVKSTEWKDGFKVGFRKAKQG